MSAASEATVRCSCGRVTFAAVAGVTITTIRCAWCSPDKPKPPTLRLVK